MNWMMKPYNLMIGTLKVLLVLILCNCTGHQEGMDSRVEVLPFYADATFQPHWIQPGSDTLSGFHKIPSFQLINQLGDTISERTFEGKIYVTNFFFTSCPGICPKMTSNMAVLQEEFINDDEVLLLSHSVTPEYDSVPVLKSYANEKGVDATKWHLVTGDQGTIYSLGRQSYFVEEDLGLEKDEDEFLHTENLVLIDKDRHIRGIYNGLNQTSIQQLIADIQTLAKE